jgi:hypothetical protein
VNSKQRRKDNRRWKYKFTIIAKDYEHYEEMWHWLDNMYGRNSYKCGWRDRHPINSELSYLDDDFFVVWEFTDQKKLVEFTLRWA